MKPHLCRPSQEIEIAIHYRPGQWFLPQRSRFCSRRSWDLWRAGVRRAFPPSMTARMSISGWW